MGSFSASLRTIGDRRGLPATVTLDQGRISIEAGEHSIGAWSLDEVHLEPTGGGYRMAAEGEHILLEIHDSASFEIELKGHSGKKAPRPPRAPRRKKPVKTESTPTPLRLSTPASTPAEKGERPQTRSTPKTATTPSASDQTSDKSASPSRLDSFLGAAEKRWGSLMPGWMFTRRMVWGLLALLALTIVVPELVSTIFLILGLLMVLGGAVVYTDQVLAAKWLPGRMSPMHVLIFGVTALMLGVLIGVIA